MGQVSGAALGGGFDRITHHQRAAHAGAVKAGQCPGDEQEGETQGLAILGRSERTAQKLAEVEDQIQPGPQGGDDQSPAQEMLES